MKTETNLNKAALERNLRLFPAARLMGNCVFFGAYMVLLFQSRGLSLTAIMSIEAIFGIGVLFLEIPTGAVADRWGRKLSILVGIAFWLGGISILALAHNLFHFILSELVASIGVSLVSGADNALEYDTLRALGREGEYGQLRRRLWAWTIFGAVIAMPLSSLMAGYDIWLTVYLYLPVILIDFFLYSLMYEPPRIGRTSYAGTIRDALRFIYQRPEIRNYVLFASTVSCASQIGFWTSNPFWLHIGVPVPAFGLLQMGMNLAAFLAGWYAIAVETRLGKYLAASILLILGPLSFFSMGYFTFFCGALLFQIVFQIQRGFLGVVVDTFINHHSDESYRATAGSVVNMSRRLFQSTLMPIMGWTMDHHGFVPAMNTMTVIFTVMGTVSAIFLLRRR